MNQQYFNTKGHILAIIAEYEAMSQKGVACSYEESVFLQLIDFYELRNEWFKAMDVTNYALQRYNASAKLYLRKAQLHMLQHQLEDAMMALDVAQHRAPTDLNIRFAKADILSLKGNFNAALTLLHHMKKQCNNETLADVFVYEAEIFENLRQYPRMFHALCQALTLMPSHEEAAQHLITAVTRIGNFKESITFNEFLLDKDPYLKWAWFNLGYALAGAQRFDEAIEAYEYAYAIDENFEMAYRECAHLLMERKRYAQALNCYMLALGRATNTISEILLQIGICYTELGDYHQGYAFFLEAIEMEPECWQTHFRIGEFHARVGCWKEAIKAYRKALFYEEDQDEILAALGEAYFQLRKFKQGKDYFAKAAEIAPEQVQYWMIPAAFLLDNGRTSAALEILEDALTNCGGAELEYAKVACLFAAGRVGEARYSLGELLKSDYDAHLALFRMNPLLELDTTVRNMIEFAKS